MNDELLQPRSAPFNDADDARLDIFQFGHVFGDMRNRNRPLRVDETVPVFPSLCDQLAILCQAHHEAIEPTA